MKQQSCFISYAHKDADRDLIEYLIFVLRNRLGSGAKFYIDAEVKYGQRFDNFMNMIQKVDVVLVLLTPEFKKRIIAREGGVFEEFRKLWDRHNDFDSTGVNAEDGEKLRFDIIPVHVSGTREDATPAELRPFKAVDLTRLRPQRKGTGEFQLSATDQLRYAPILEELALEIVNTSALRSNEYQRLSETYFDDLFVDLKAHWDNPVAIAQVPLKRTFVKTVAYKKVANQGVYFVVGRKGSGKSTLIQSLPILHAERYLCVINIVADNIHLESLYALYSTQQFRSDSKTVFPRVKAFEYTWEATLLLSLILGIGGIANSKSPLTSPAIAKFAKKVVRTGNANSDVPWTAEASFVFVFNKIIEFTRECVTNARDELALFAADLNMGFARENFLRFVFGAKVLRELREQLRGIQDKRILITLDGFDSAFDGFRLNALRMRDKVALRKRADFEIDWLRSFLNLTQMARANPDNYFYGSLDFCAAAPMDRFLEAVQIDRDSYRNWNRWCAIQWSGLELSILLRKRLEAISDSTTDKSFSPQKRLEEVLSHKQFVHIPVELDFEYHGKQKSMPLFMYVLRHSFWRPRGVLLHYARLLALAEQLQQHGNLVTVDALRKCVKLTTFQIIRSEFINELRSVVVNIEAILKSFRYSEIVISWVKLSKIISKCDYCFATATFESKDTVNKVRFLYNVGFIGLSLTSEQKTALGVWHSHVFRFSEGAALFEDDFLEERDFGDFKYVIHPVFTEYLKLDTSGTDFLLTYNWDYLKESEASFSAQGGV